MATDSIDSLLERFRRGPEVIAATLTGAAGPELDYRPSFDGWCIRQIVAHVADAELVAADRFRRIIAEDSPSLIGFDEQKWAGRLDYATRKPSQALETFRRIRSESYDILKALPPEAFERSGIHNERGLLTLLALLQDMAGHAESHAQQIRRTRDQYKASRAKA